MAHQQCPECGADIDSVAARECAACGVSLEQAKPAAFDQTVAAPLRTDGSADTDSGSGSTDPGSGSTDSDSDSGDATLLGVPVAAAAAGNVDPMIGKNLGGCVIETLLGTGAMGAVYRARQTKLDRVVAVKTVRPELAMQESLLARFRREARTIGRFNTPHVVQVFDFGDEGGVHFIVMEFVAGASLRNYAHQQPGECLSTEDGIRFLAQACEGLLEAQAAEVLHRDIKPDNLMLSDRGVLKIADFGIAKILTQDVELTMASEMTGTPLYMSPEQCRGSELDFRSDMYSLGATFYYLLSGRPPAQGSSVYELLQTKTKLACLRLDTALPDPSAAGPLGKIIERMTQLNPKDRYPGYDELLADLRRLEAGEELEEATVGIRDGKGADGPVLRDVETDGVEAEAASNVAKRVLIVAALVTLIGVVGWQAGWFGDAPEENSTVRVSTDDGVRATHDAGGAPLPFTPRDPMRPKGGSTDGEPTDGGTAEEGTTDGTGSPGSSETGPSGVGPAPDSPDTDPGKVEPGDLDPADVPSNGVDPVISEVDPTDSETTDGSNEAAEIAAYDAQIERLTADFIREGPESVETEASALVEDLLRRPIQFARTFQAARVLNRDVKLAMVAQDSVRGMNRPSVELDRLDVVERYFQEQRDKAKPPAEASAALVTWLGDEFSDGFSIDREALRDEAENRLRDRYEQCQQFQRDGEMDALGPALASLAEVKARLVAIFPESDFGEAVPRDDIVALESAIEDFGRAASLRDEIEEIVRSMDGMALGDWRARSEEAGPAIAKLRERAEVEGLGMPELRDKLTALESKVGFWKDYSAALDAACQQLTNSDPARAERTLTALAAQHRVDDLDEYQRVDTVRRELASAFDAVLGRAELSPARDSVLGCRQQLGPIRATVPTARVLDQHLVRVLAALEELAQLTTGMAAVAGDRVQTGGERIDVPAFWIDRTEVPREVVRVSLGEIHGEDDKDAKARFRRLIGNLRTGKFDADPRLPMADVSWNEAVELLARQRKQLPRPAEWHLAAFGPADSRTQFPWGDSVDPSPTQLNSRGEAIVVDQGGHAVRFGEGDESVHHLVGNVAEWLDVPGERKPIVGGDYGMTRRKRIRFATGDTTTLRPSQSKPRVGFRGVVRPADVFLRRGIAMPVGR